MTAKCYYISCRLNNIGKVLACRCFGRFFQQAHLNYVADLGPMSLTVKVNVVSSVIGSTSSLSSGISQLCAQGRISSKRLVDIVFIYKLRCTLIRTHFMKFFRVYIFYAYCTLIGMNTVLVFLSRTRILHDFQKLAKMAKSTKQNFEWS